jgi:teichoic acid transport system ATP-binding protein
MSFEYALSLHGISKCYQIYSTPAQRLWQMLWRGHRQFFREFWALNSIDLQVKKGEAVGIVGRNGSGKSTLLQILCGTVTPSAGEIRTDGRIAALLELGAGFNPEFSGEENVFLNGSILGLSREEVVDRFHSICEFADIGQFIHQPVKTYSSGMVVRLAFATAVHVSPEILLVDEALAVGDSRFQLKCIQKMEEFRDRGATILFVSHADEQIRRFCNRAVWLHEGRVQADGETNDVVDRYRDFLSRTDSTPLTASPGNGPAVPIASAAVVGVMARVVNVQLSSDALKPFEEIVVTVDYEVLEEDIEGLLIGVAIYDAGRTYIFGPNTHLERVDVPTQRGVHRVRYVIPELPLLSREYAFDVGLFTNTGMVCLDYRPACATFTVRSGYISEGLVYIRHRWEVDR